MFDEELSEVGSGISDAIDEFFWFGVFHTEPLFPDGSEATGKGCVGRDDACGGFYEHLERFGKGHEVVLVSTESMEEDEEYFWFLSAEGRGF